MHILWDMDGPIVQFEKRMYDILRGLISPDEVIDPENRTTFRLRDQYPKKHHQLILDIMSSAGFYAAMEPVQGTILAMEEQLGEGHEVSIVTAPLIESPFCAQEKFEWVRKNLGTEWLHRLVIAYDKTNIKGDVLIDDKPVIIGKGQREWRQIVYDLPHNRNFTHLPRLYKSSDWRHAISTVIPQH